MEVRPSEHDAGQLTGRARERELAADRAFTIRSPIVRARAAGARARQVRAR